MGISILAWLSSRDPHIGPRRQINTPKTNYFSGKCSCHTNSTVVLNGTYFVKISISTGIPGLLINIYLSYVIVNPNDHIKRE